MRTDFPQVTIKPLSPTVLYNASLVSVQACGEECFEVTFHGVLTQTVANDLLSNWRLGELKAEAMQQKEGELND